MTTTNKNKKQFIYDSSSIVERKKVLHCIYGVVNISNVFVISNTGKYHMKQNKPNQDYALALEKGGISVVVLADGAGSFDAGGVAARLLVPEIVEWMSSNFLELYYCDGAIVRKRLVYLITKLLRGYSEKHNLNSSDLACTLIAVAVDSKGRGIAFHLGDGIILRQRDQGTCCSVISSPENGLTTSTTYLTMNCNMFEHCRFYRLQESGPFRLIAMTDGAAAHLVEQRGRDGWVYTGPCFWEEDPLVKYLKGVAPSDDYSLAILKSCP